MAKTEIKEAAESVLRELPGVVGAFVQPDAFGGPREIHLLIKAGQRPREFALRVKSVLENRLRVPIDQRIISIAQLAEEPEPGPAEGAADAEPEASGTEPGGPSDRTRLVSVESEVAGKKVLARVRLDSDAGELLGESAEFDTGDGRARAATLATLQALNLMTGERARFGLDFAAVVEAVGRTYALVSVAVSSPHLGRGSVRLSGAHRIDEDVETASALAVLKATNRSIEFVMGGAVRRRRIPHSP